MWTDRKRRFSNTMILCVIICELLAWRMLGKGRYRISGRSLALTPTPRPRCLFSADVSLRWPHDLNAWNRLTAKMIRIRYVWMRNKSPETCNFTRQRDGQGEKIYHFCFISDVVMTRSPLFSPNLFYWPTLSNWVTWNNWEKVRKKANTTFLRRFHQCCRCRILRSLLNTERIFGATLKFTDYFIDCYKYFTRYIFIILIWCNLNTKYLMALNFCGNLISWITDPFFR